MRKKIEKIGDNDFCVFRFLCAFVFAFVQELCIFAHEFNIFAHELGIFVHEFSILYTNYAFLHTNLTFVCIFRVHNYWNLWFYILNPFVILDPKP